MATLKRRLHRKNASGGYDVVYLQTTSDLVLMSDGSTTLTSKISSMDTAINGKAASNHTHSGYAASSHSHPDATTSAAGFMTPAMVSKLNGIAAGANAYSHPSAKQCSYAYIHPSTKQCSFNAVTGYEAAHIMANALCSKHSKPGQSTSSGVTNYMLNSMKGYECPVTLTGSHMSSDSKYYTANLLGVGRYALITYDLSAIPANRAIGAVAIGNFIASANGGIQNTTVDLYINGTWYNLQTNGTWPSQLVGFSQGSGTYQSGFINLAAFNIDTSNATSMAIKVTTSDYNTTYVYNLYCQIPVNNPAFTVYPVLY